jgi:hypothetical protein
MKTPDTVFSVPLVAAVCPEPTLPIPGYAPGIAEIAKRSAGTARQWRVTVVVGSRVRELSSRYRDSPVLFAVTTGGGVGGGHR